MKAGTRRFLLLVLDLSQIILLGLFAPSAFTEDQRKKLQPCIGSFSISHDNSNVRIYGHYPLVEEDKTTYYRPPHSQIRFHCAGWQGEMDRQEGIAQGAIGESQHGKDGRPRFYAENLTPARRCP
jgi:hypothetical protein